MSVHSTHNGFGSRTNTFNNIVNVTVTGDPEIDQLRTELIAARSETERLEDALSGARDMIRSLSYDLERAESATGIDELRRQVDEFSSTAEQAAREFTSYLHTLNLSDGWGDVSDYRLREYLDEIRNGAMTSQQAIFRLKTECSDLLDAQYIDRGGLFDSNQLQSLYTTLERINDTMGEIVGRLERIETEGVKTSGITDSSTNNIAETLLNIADASRAMSEGSGDAIGSLSNLINSITEFAGIDSSRLISVSNAFKHISSIGEGSFSNKSVENIIYLAKQLSALGDLGVNAVRFDFTGLENFKVSSTISHLSDFLGTVTSDQIANLERIAQINFEGLSNLKISKATVDNLTNLFLAAQTTSPDALMAYAEYHRAIAQSAGAETSAAATPTAPAQQAATIESSKVTETNAAWEKHAEVVAKAEAAEMKKAAASEKLSGELSSEAANVEQIAASSERHVEALNKENNTASRTASAVKNVANAEAEAAQAATAAADSTEQAEASERAYHNALATVANMLKQVQTQRAKLASYTDGAEQPEYAALGELEESLQLLQDAGMTTPYDNLRDSIAEIKHSISDTLQSMNLFIMAAKERTAAASGQSAAEEELAQSIREVSDAETEAANSAESAEEAQRRAEQESKKRSDLLTRTIKLYDQITAAQLKWSGAANDSRTASAYTDLERLRGALEELRNSYDTMSPEAFASKLAEINQQFAQQASVIKGAQGATQSYLDRGLSQLTSRLTYMFGLANVVMRAVREIKQMVSTAVELDSKLNELQIVTRASTSDMDKYAQSIHAMAKETAQSTQDLISATTVFARLGYTMDESAALAKYTAMLQGVGDISASDAQNAMTAIIKAFGKNVGDIEDVMDKLVVVGNNFPISVSQLAEGMNNASSMLAVAGNTFEQSVALLTAANTTIQNVSKASTGLRTIAARIRRTTTGEDDEGEIVEEAKYEEMLAALTKQKVYLTDVNGEYRTTYDIMKDIAAVWDELTSMEQAAVIEALAGTRQQNIFTSLVTQFQEAEQAMERMEGATGELRESYDIYLESIQAHVQQFKDAFAELSAEFVNSDLAKAVVDAGTKILEIFSKVITGSSQLRTVLVGLIGLFVAANIDKVLTKLQTKMTSAFATAISSLARFSSAFRSTYTRTLSQGTSAFKSFFSAAKAGFAEMVASASAAQIAVAAITAALMVWSAVRAAREKSIQEYRSSSEQALSNAKEYDSIKQLYDAYNEAAIANDGNIESKQRLTEATLRLAEALGYEGDAAQLSAEKIKTLTISELNAAMTDAQKSIVDSEKALLKTYTGLGSYTKNIIEPMMRNALGLSSTAILDDEQKIEGLIKVYETAKQRQNELIKSGDTSSGAYDSWQYMLNNLGEDIERIYDARDAYGDISDAIKDVDATYRRTQFYKKYQGIVSRVEDHMEEIQSIKKLVDEWNSLNNGNVDYGNRPFITGAEMLDAGWEEFRDHLDDIATTYTEIKTIGSSEALWAVAVTPILDDGTVLTQDELRKQLDRLVTDYGVDELLASDELGIIVNVQPGNYDADYWDEYQEKIDKIKGSHLEKALSSGYYDLRRAARETNMSIEEFLNTYGKIYDISNKNIDGLLSLEDELSAATEKLEKFKDATKVEKDDVASEYASAFKKFNEDWEAGRNDSNAVKAAIDLFIPDSIQQSLGYDVNKLGELLHSKMYQAIFNDKDSDDYGANFARYLRDNYTDALKGIVEITNHGDTFDIAIESYSALADALNMDYEALMAVISALDVYGTQMMLSKEDANKLATEIGFLDGNMTNLEKVQTILNYLSSSSGKNYTAIEMRQLLDELEAYGHIDLSTVKEVNQLISNAVASQEELDGTDSNPSVSLNTSAFDSVYSYVNRQLDILDRRTVSPSVYLDTTNAGSGGGANSRGNHTTGGWETEASGTRNAKRGTTLVNELGPELISDNGEAYIANGGKPGFTYLGEGAIVFNAEETKEILKGRFSNIPSRAHSQGTASVRNRLFGGARTRARASGSSTILLYDYSSGSGIAYQRCPVCDKFIKDKLTGECPYCHTYLVNGKVKPAATTVSTAIANIFNNVKSAAVATVPSVVKTTSNSGGGGGGGAGASTSSPQKVDWIAIRISRIQRAITDLQKVAQSAFKTLSKRLDANRESIRQTTDEIKTMNSAYSRYMSEAESVALPPSIKDMIRHGEIDITMYDEETRGLISEYQEWYEKALDCESAIEDLHQSIAELYQDNFNNVQKDYENRLAETAHSIEMINRNMSMAETQGYIDSIDFYSELIGNTTSEIDILQNELSNLQMYFQEAMDSGEIAEASEAWYEMRQSIDATEEALADANIQLEEYKRSVRELSWGYFDYAHERISQITEEAEFLIDLMSNDNLFQDNGQFNDLGAATAAMHAVNYDTYMAQADEYAKEIQRIQRELAEDPYDKELIERREELIGLQQDSIKNAESEKDAIKDLVSQGIQIELEALKELISAYTDSLDSAKDLYEYQKKLAEQTSDIASIEKQLSAYQNDTSEENRARVQKLQKQLRESRQNLQETEYEQSIADQKKLLNDLYSEYEENLNSRLDNVDALMGDIINGVNANRDAINMTLQDVTDKVGYTITDGFRNVMQDELSNYNYMFENVTGIHSTLTRMYDMVAAMASASGAVRAYAKGGLVDYTGLAAVHGSPGNPEMVLSATDTSKFLEAAAMLRSAPSLSDISGTTFLGSNGFAGTVVNGLSITIPIDHVQDYNDMIAQMQRDPKFDRLINAITLDRATGKSNLGKYGVRI